MILLMKMMQHWIAGLSLILFSFGLTTSSRAQSPQASPAPLERAVVAARTVGVTESPHPDALKVLHLKQGDSVDVVSRQPGYVRIRYHLEGEFPIEGWLPEGALTATTPQAQNLSAQRQPYQVAPDSTTARPEVTELDRQAVADRVEPNLKGPMTNLSGARSATILTPPKQRTRGSGPWFFEVQALTGMNFWHEQLTTKLPSTNAYGTEPFLAYTMQGFMLSLDSRASRFFKEIEAGGFLTYDMTIFRGQVPEASSGFDPHIRSTSVQALLHEARLGPFVRMSYPVAKQITLIPEARLYGAFSLFSTNQLQTVADTSSGFNAQSVLFSYTTMQAGFEFVPRASLPYNLTLSPEIGVSFFTTFAEGPIVTTSGTGNLDVDDQIRTGSPSGADFALSYGAQLAWNLKDYHWETLNLVVAYRVRDYSRKFSGQGNRAGIRTLDAKSTAGTESFSLGAQYLF